MTSVSFGVAINDDNIFEDMESFNLTISQSLLPDSVIVGTPHQVIVFIDRIGKL